MVCQAASRSSGVPATVAWTSFSRVGPLTPGTRAMPGATASGGSVPSRSPAISISGRAVEAGFRGWGLMRAVVLRDMMR